MSPLPATPVCALEKAFEVLHSLKAAIWLDEGGSNTAASGATDAPPPEELAQIIEKSALIPFMEGYLSTDSMLEMEQAGGLALLLVLCFLCDLMSQCQHISTDK